jgi:hypothetical protein
MHGPTCVFWASPTPFSLQFAICSLTVEILKTGDLIKSATLSNFEPFQYYLKPVDFWIEIAFYVSPRSVLRNLRNS